MSNMYEGILITCDTREQSALIQNHKTESAIKKDAYFISDYTDEEKWELAKKRPRIYGIYDHFEKKGALVGIGKLDRCDYHIIGEHKGQQIDIGVEFKTIDDFAGSHQDLVWKLLEASKMYKHVALFIEGHINVVTRGDFFFIEGGCGADTLRFDLYQARLNSWSDAGIFCRQFDKIEYFVANLENLIDYVSKPDHTNVTYREDCASDLALKVLLQISGVKIKTATKLLGDTNITLSKLLSYDLVWFQKRVGEKTGKKIYNTFHGGDVNEERA